MREAVRADGMPESISQKNGQPILEEDFADNAFAYVSIQLMQPGARDDGWHTDGGCSLLHAAVTLFGTRSVEVKVDGTDQVTLHQTPGSFYVGNFAALPTACATTIPSNGCNSIRRRRRPCAEDLASAATAK